MRAVPGNTEKVPGVYQEIQAGENERAVDSADAVAGAVHSGDTGDGADSGAGACKRIYALQRM